MSDDDDEFVQVSLRSMGWMPIDRSHPKYDTWELPDGRMAVVEKGHDHAVIRRRRRDGGKNQSG